ncbi:MAG: aldo/keto reductase [Deltaproteobacteria bacterium]|nr:aldo/keto reductase [Deltaproteobacteria bacterium]
MIARMPFGSTGHLSTRTIFGAAALGAMKQERADHILELLLEYGVNHIDVAASYGDAELRIGSWMKLHRDKFFLATKTGERTAKGARAGIERSLERLQVDHVDLIQFHNLTDEPGWKKVFGAGGALEGAVEARKQGLVRFIGVTGHGTRAPEMHLRSLDRFPFDSVLFPYNYMMMRNPEYAADVKHLIDLCVHRGIAVQTIKSIARRRWREGDQQKHFSWYEPVKEPDVLRRVVHWVLSQPHIFLNTSSDATLLPMILEAARSFADNIIRGEIEDSLKADAAAQEMEPIFIRGEADGI